MKPRVLIVDDTESARQLLQVAADLLRRSQVWDIQFAASAAEARLKVEAGAFQVYVLDVAMPEETGLSLARWIREHDKATQIIFFTAYDGFMNQQVAEEVGAFAFLTKTIEPAEVYSEVERALYAGEANTGEAKQ